MNIRIRLFDWEHDATAVLQGHRELNRLHARLWCELTGEDHDPAYWNELLETSDPDTDYLEELKQAASSPDHRIFVAESEEGDFAGFLHVDIHKSPRHGIPEGGCINEIFVRPELRGKGVARLLMQAGEDWLAERGMTRGHVFVTSNNPAAVALYQSFGYVIADYRMMKRVSC